MGVIRDRERGGVRKEKKVKRTDSMWYTHRQRVHENDRNQEEEQERQSVSSVTN